MLVYVIWSNVCIYSSFIPHFIVLFKHCAIGEIRYQVFMLLPMQIPLPTDFLRLSTVSKLNTGTSWTEMSMEYKNTTANPLRGSLYITVWPIGLLLILSTSLRIIWFPLFSTRTLCHDAVIVLCAFVTHNLDFSAAQDLVELARFRKCPYWFFSEEKLIKNSA